MLVILDFRTSLTFGTWQNIRLLKSFLIAHQARWVGWFGRKTWTNLASSEKNKYVCCMFGCLSCVKYTPKFFMGYKLSRKNVFVKVKMFFFIYILFNLQIELLLLVSTKRRGCQQQIFLESFSFRSHIFLPHLLFSTTLN